MKFAFYGMRSVIMVRTKLRSFLKRTPLDILILDHHEVARRLETFDDVLLAEDHCGPALLPNSHGLIIVAPVYNRINTIFDK